MDKASHSASDSHLFLRGDLQDHEAFIKIQNSSGSELLRVDHNGKLHTPVGIVAPEITSLTAAVSSNTTSVGTIVTTVTSNTNLIISNLTSILSNTTTGITNTTKLLAQDTIKVNVDNIISTLNGSSEATSSAIDGSLVKRDNTETQFTKINCNICEVEKTVAMYGDSNIQWIPQAMVNGTLTNDAKAIVRVGRNHDEIGYSNIGDGIEIIGLVPQDGVGSRNSVIIAASEYSPSLEMHCNKSTGQPWIRLRGHQGESKIEISETGVAISISEEANFSVTPNVEFSQMELYAGVSRLNFTLADKWDDTSNELVIKLNRYVPELGRIVSAYEVYLDESEVSSNYIDSVIYIDRITKNLRKTGASFVRIVLKLELLSSESEIPTGTKFVLTLNNKELLI